MGRRREVIKYLTKEQLRALLRVIPKKKLRDRLLINLMYLYALRREEAGMLTLDRFKGDTIFVVRLKGGVSLTYDLFPSTRKLLRQFLAERRNDGCRCLFRGRPRGRGCAPLSGKAINNIVRKYAQAAALPPDLWHSHVLRHSLGTHMANEGIDIADVAERLGHAELSSTSIYFQITSKRRAKIYRRMLRSREIVRS